MLSKIFRNVSPIDIPPTFIDGPSVFLTSLFDTAGPHSTVYLAQKSIWELDSIIKINVHHAELATEGYPSDPDLMAQIHTIGPTESTAISFHNTHHVKISNVIVDGRQPDLGSIEGGGALITCGGRNGKDPIIQHSIIRHPRGWSCLHVFDHCQGARVINNQIGPAGLPAPNGPWADGLSIACKDGLICVSNTIIARERNLLGAINMVDAGPYGGDYTNTRVLNNMIQSAGAYIKLGIGIGPLTWSPKWLEKNRGGQVMDNMFGPGRFGYAIGMAGCSDFIVRGNKVVEGTHFEGDMSQIKEPLNGPPTAFLRATEEELIENCRLQDDFVKGRACWLIGIEEGRSNRLRFQGSQLDLTNQESSWIILNRVTIGLDQIGTLFVRSNSNPNQILWRSKPSLVKATIRNGNFRLGFEENGHLTIRETTSKTLIWDPMRSLTGRVNVGSKDEVSLTVSDKSPFVTVWTRFSNSIAWASEYLFEKGHLHLKPGDFICLPIDPNSIPPPIPPRIQTNSRNRLSPPINEITRVDINQTKIIFIYFDPMTSNLVIHKGKTYDEPYGEVIWASGTFGNLSDQIISLEDDPSICVYQDDGNLVIYGNPNEVDRCDKRRALWASGTNCDKLRFINQIDKVGIEFLDSNGNIVKSLP